MVITKTCLGTLPLLGGNTYELVASPQTSNVQQNVVRINCDTMTGPITISLPEIASYFGLYGNVELIISDTGNNAGANNITIVAFAPDKIEGAMNHIIASNSASERLTIAADGFWTLSA